MYRFVFMIMALLGIAVGGCWKTQSPPLAASPDVDTDADTDTDVDSDSDADTDPDTGDEIVCTGETWYGDVYIEHDEELEALRGYAATNGDLNISCDDCADIDDLVCLEEVGDSLVINAPELTNLDGLSSLAEVGAQQDLGAFIIKDNEKLADLGGLSSLTRIGNLLEITRNPLIEDLDGLAQIQRDEDEGMLMLTISQNESLENVDGLSWVGQLSELSINNNYSLGDLDGLGGATVIDAELVVAHNTALGEVAFFEGLEALGAVTIAHNASLTSLGVLPAGLHLEGSVVVEDNPQLPYCQICQMIQNVPDVDFGDLEDNLEDACWNGALDCP